MQLGFEIFCFVNIQGVQSNQEQDFLKVKFKYLKSPYISPGLSTYGSSGKLVDRAYPLTIALLESQL